MQRIHATAVALGGRGILITGPSGCGKSDLALRLLEHGALLIADDQTELSVEQGQLIARCPAAIKGLIEARYIGPLQAPSTERAVIALVLESGTPERVPEPEFITLEGIQLPLLQLPYLEASTPYKVKLWLEQQRTQA